MSLLDVFRRYDLETVRDVLTRLDSVSEAKESTADAYCPEVIYEDGPFYAQKSLKQRAFQVYASPDAKKPVSVHINMVYRLEHETEPEDGVFPDKTVSIRFSTLFFNESSLYGRLLVSEAVSELFIDGITPAVIVTLNATKCPVYGNLSFVEHMLDPEPLKPVESAESNLSHVLQILHLFDTMKVNGMKLMDPSVDDFLLSRFRSRRGFRGIDISAMDAMDLEFSNSARVKIPLTDHRYVRLGYMYPIRLAIPGEHAISPQTRVEKTPLQGFKSIVMENGLADAAGVADIVSSADSFESLRDGLILKAKASFSNLSVSKTKTLPVSSAKTRALRKRQVLTSD